MIIHTVQRGDTVQSIARLYGIVPYLINEFNDTASQPYLVIGQALIILIPKITHTVKNGESLYSIASDYNIPVMSLLQKNPSLIKNSTVYPGQQIIIEFEDEGSDDIYIYGFVYPNVRESILRRCLPYVTTCAIFGYGIRADGSLIPIDDQPIINLCYEYKTAPFMLLTSLSEDGNFDSGIAARMFNDVELQNRVIANMIEIMKQKGYLGLDLDFEYINSEDRNAYVRFVQNTVRQMNQNGFSVNVDLAPKTSDSQPGSLYEGHNYAALGAAANTVLLMTYEWGYTYGPPMAVAPINPVRRVVSYAVGEIDNNKIYMGIPNYAYDWQLPFEKGVTRARGMGNQQAVLVAAQNGAEIQFDEETQTPFFEYFAPNGTKHIVWFEDVRSIQAKYKVIDDFDLRGGGYWNLMHPFASNWSFVGSQYNIIKTV